MSSRWILHLPQSGHLTEGFVTGVSAGVAVGVGKDPLFLSDSAIQPIIHQAVERASDILSLL